MGLSLCGLGRSQGVILVLGFLVTLSMHLLLFSYSPLLRDIAFEMRLSDAEAGLVFSFCILPLMVFRIPWGMLFDRRGLRTTMEIALILIGLFGLLRGFAANYGMLLASQFLLGAGLSAVIPCLPKLVSSWFPRQRAGLATGVCMAGFPFGEVLGLSLTPYLAVAMSGWRQVFQAYGIWALILMVLWWKFASENPEKRPTQAVGSSGSLRRDFTLLLGMKEVWLLTGLYFCAAGCFDTTLLWLPDILESAGAGPFTATTVASMLPVGFFVATTVVGTSSDRIGLRRPFVLVLGLVSGAAIYLTGAMLSPATYATAFLAGFCTVGVLTLTLTIPIELPKLSSFLSSALGLISSVGNAGSFFLPTVVGQIRDLTGTFLVSILILAVIGECMFLLGLMLPETGRKRSKKC